MPYASSPNTETSGSITDEPSALKLISQHETGSWCTSVCFDTLSGDLLLGCGDGMKLLKKGSCEVREETYHNRAKVAVHKVDVFIAVHKDRKLINVMSYNRENREDEMLFSFPMVSTFAAFISACDEYVACIDNHNMKPWTLKLYNRREKTVQTLKLPRLTALIFNIHFLRDGYLLATGADDAGKRYLNKYRISSTKATDDDAAASLVWSCQLEKACGIAVSADERLICVSEMDTKRIYVLNSDGWYNTCNLIP
mgnify:CR=1 FL=1